MILRGVSKYNILLVNIVLVIVLCISCKGEEETIITETSDIEVKGSPVTYIASDPGWDLIESTNNEKVKGLSKLYGELSVDVYADSIPGIITMFNDVDHSLNQVLGIPDRKYYSDNPELVPVVIPARINYVDGSSIDATGHYVTPELIYDREGYVDVYDDVLMSKFSLLERKMLEVESGSKQTFGFLVNKSVRSIVYKGTVSVLKSNTYEISSKEPLVKTEISDVKLIERGEKSLTLDLPINGDYYLLVYGLSETNKVINEITRSGSSMVSKEGANKVGREQVSIGYTYPIDKIMIKVYKRAGGVPLSFSFEHEINARILEAQERKNRNRYE